MLDPFVHVKLCVIARASCTRFGDRIQITVQDWTSFKIQFSV